MSAPWICDKCGQLNAAWATECGRCQDVMPYNSTERQLMLRCRELNCVVRRWRAIALLFAVVAIALLVIVVIQCEKLP